jgi:hypothetical protein
MKWLRVLSFLVLLTTWSVWGTQEVTAFVEESDNSCDAWCSRPYDCCLVSEHPLWDTCDEYCGICVGGSTSTIGGCDVDLIRFRGHFSKGGYDVHDGKRQTETTTAPDVL